jgi:cupin 2 domain-containing protein
MKVKSLFQELADEPPDELFETLVSANAVRIERIVSVGHASAEDFWYDQEGDEWVLVVTGSAGLQFEGSEEVLVLKPGDWINIPAHKKHRVEWTDPAGKTIWLAVHY